MLLGGGNEAKDMVGGLDKPVGKFAMDHQRRQCEPRGIRLDVKGPEIGVVHAGIAVFPAARLVPFLRSPGVIPVMDLRPRQAYAAISWTDDRGIFDLPRRLELCLGNFAARNAVIQRRPAAAEKPLEVFAVEILPGNQGQRLDPRVVGADSDHLGGTLAYPQRCQTRGVHLWAASQKADCRLHVRYLRHGVFQAAGRAAALAAEARIKDQGDKAVACQTRGILHRRLFLDVAKRPQNDHARPLGVGAQRRKQQARQRDALIVEGDAQRGVATEHFSHLGD